MKARKNKPALKKILLRLLAVTLIIIPVAGCVSSKSSSDHIEHYKAFYRNDTIALPMEALRLLFWVLALC
jgi:hypothetical protein